MSFQFFTVVFSGLVLIHHYQIVAAAMETFHIYLMITLIIYDFHTNVHGESQCCQSNEECKEGQLGSKCIKGTYLYKIACALIVTHFTQSERFTL